jgi:hypothetical protein
MNLDQLMTRLKDAGANENTLSLAKNCFELGRANAGMEMVDMIKKSFIDGYTQALNERDAEQQKPEILN